jgi:hypothetical protein
MFNESDFDPLVNIHVIFEIMEIRSLEKEDRQLFFEEVIDKNSDPDFYLKIFINGIEFKSQVWWNTKYIYEPGWYVRMDVPDDKEIVEIRIQLWDAKDEDYSSDRLCDISRDFLGSQDDSYDVEIEYSIKTGRWSGDDFLETVYDKSDPSGYGRLNGCDDGTIYKKDRDCEIWFNIYQDDYDDDGIPYWAEENIYYTDPTEKNIGDPDNDGIPVQWEWRWGYDPFESNNHMEIDSDGDSINNVEEYLTSDYFSDPFRKDVFVELDIMDNGPNGEIIEFPDGSKELIATAFNRQNIVFHLDDGRMNSSGSEIIPFDHETDVGWGQNSEINDIYRNYFLHNDENNWRKGVFHYGVLIYASSYVAGAAFGNNRFYITSRGHEKKSTSRWLERDVVFASAYMHELGHTFGFRPIPGHNQYSKFPYQIGWWINRPYKSCMNYGYMYTTVDYSDGSRIAFWDYDDWSRMELNRFDK